MRIGIEISQIGNWDFELDGLRLSWGEAHFLERLQLLGRALEQRILLTYIELHDFLTRALALVGHVDPIFFTFTDAFKTPFAETFELTLTSPYSNSV